MADSGVWRWQIETLRKQFPGLGLNSAYRAGDNDSWHGKGNAVDVPPRMDVFNWIAQNYPNSAELIYSPAGNRQIKNGKPYTYTGAVKAQHYSHVHWAMASAGGASTGTDSAGDNPLLAPLTDTYAAIKNLYSFVQFIANPGNWARFGVAIFGSLILVAGLWGLANGSKNVTQTVKGSVKGIQKAVNV